MTNEQIRELMAEAAEAGDLDMADVCGRALRGDVRARERCVEVAADAAAQDGSEPDALCACGEPWGYCNCPDPDEVK